METENKDWKPKIGDRVEYQGVAARIEDIHETAYQDGESQLCLVAEDDPTMTTTCRVRECSPLMEGEEYDSSEALGDARTQGALVMFMADRLTDKYFRDGNH